MKRLLLTVCVIGSIAAVTRGDLRIHLPRETSVSAPTIRLKDIAVIVCPDAAIKSAAGDVVLGRGPFARETITLDRTTLLARLASSGVSASMVHFSGAQKVRVCSMGRVVPAEDLVAAAEKFLSTSPQVPDAHWRLQGSAARLDVPAGKALRFKAGLISVDSAVARVRVAVVDTDQEIGAAELTFRRVYTVRRAVAVRDLEAGEAMTVENVRLEEQEVSSPQETYLPAAGDVAAVRILAGTAIRAALVRPPQAPVLVKRNQQVVLRVVGSGFVVSTLGLAMQDGSAGQIIKVRNVDSSRIVSGRVMPDGSIQPGYQE